MFKFRFDINEMTFLDKSGHYLTCHYGYVDFLIKLPDYPNQTEIVTHNLDGVVDVINELTDKKLLFKITRYFYAFSKSLFALISYIPSEIKDFNKFVGFFLDNVFDYIEYYFKLYKDKYSTQLYINVSIKMFERISDILKNEE